MRIATFDINGVNRRLQHLLAWLRANEPDVVCLQELKCAACDFPEEALGELGYSGVWRGESTWNGVAILGRNGKPVLTRRELPGNPGDKEGRYIEASFSGMLIGCIYLPHGNPQPGPRFEYKLAWFERLITHAARLLASKTPVVLAGDYNIIPTDFDIYSSEAWRENALLHPESRECYQRLLAQGWTDALRKLNPSEPMYTFWDVMLNGWPEDAGMRLDHLLLSPQLAGKLTGAGVDRRVRGELGASDHAPAWIELNV